MRDKEGCCGSLPPPALLPVSIAFAELSLLSRGGAVSGGACMGRAGRPLVFVWRVLLTGGAARVRLGEPTPRSWSRD